MGTIPEQDLQKAFDRAFADHDTSFPVSAYDLKTAYERVIENERVENRRRMTQQSIQEMALSSSRNYWECEHCNGCGFRYVDDPHGSLYRGVVRCDRCEYWARRDMNRPEPRKL